MTSELDELIQHAQELIEQSQQLVAKNEELVREFQRIKARIDEINQDQGRPRLP